VLLAVLIGGHVAPVPLGAAVHEARTDLRRCDVGGELPLGLSTRLSLGVLGGCLLGNSETLQTREWSDGPLSST